MLHKLPSRFLGCPRSPVYIRGRASAGKRQASTTRSRGNCRLCVLLNVMREENDMVDLLQQTASFVVTQGERVQEDIRQSDHRPCGRVTSRQSSACHAAADDAALVLQPSDFEERLRNSQDIYSKVEEPTFHAAGIFCVHKTPSKQSWNTKRRLKTRNTL